MCAIFQIKTNLLVIQQNINILHTRPYIPPSFRNKVGALHRKRFQKHPLFTAFLLVFTVDVCNISNKNQPPSNLAKYQYFNTRYLISLLHFEIKSALSITNFFLKHPLFTTLSPFFNSEFQINTNLLIIQRNINIFTKGLYIPPTFRKNMALSIANVLQNVHFYHISLYF